jgi:uncharacterized protein
MKNVRPTAARCIIAAVLMAMAASLATGQTGASASAKTVPTVFMTSRITPDAMVAIYKALGRQLPGKVAVKLSTGEPGGGYYLSPNLIKDLVRLVSGTIVECNTAYGGQRANTAIHKIVAQQHGFTAIADVDIMDEDGSISLPFPEGSHVREDLVGSHFSRYDSFLVLSHFKGHEMGGFGGALKNVSIGIASLNGKLWIHSAGTIKDKADFRRAFATDQDAFVESMAEAAGAVMRKLGDRIQYINVMNNLSIDCDCNAHPRAPELSDIGILGSTDPVALDKACVDLVYAADRQKSASLRERIESRHGTLILKHAEELGLGSQGYRIVRIDG